MSKPDISGLTEQQLDALLLIECAMPNTGWGEAFVALSSFEARVQAGEFPDPSGKEATAALIDIIARALMAAEARGRAEGAAEERKACASVASQIADGRSKQRAAAKAAKRRTEVRDFESMAMSASEVAIAIRKRRGE